MQKKLLHILGQGYFRNDFFNQRNENKIYCYFFEQFEISFCIKSAQRWFVKNIPMALLLTGCPQKKHEKPVLAPPTCRRFSLCELYPIHEDAFPSCRCQKQVKILNSLASRQKTTVNFVSTYVNRVCPAWWSSFCNTSSRKSIQFEARW